MCYCCTAVSDCFMWVISFPVFFFVFFLVGGGGGGEGAEGVRGASVAQSFKEVLGDVAVSVVGSSTTPAKQFFSLIHLFISCRIGSLQKSCQSFLCGPQHTCLLGCVGNICYGCWSGSRQVACNNAKMALSDLIVISL